VTKPTFEDLPARIRNAHPPDDGLLFWWLGQHSWAFKSASATLGIDLYLSPSPKRLMPPAFRPEEADFFDLFLCSHEHSDHLDLPVLGALAEASPKAAFLVPRAAAESTRRRLPADTRVIEMDGRNSIALDRTRCVSIPAAHELLDVSPQYGSRFLGYLVYADGFCIYHSGDTCIYEGLLTRLQQHPVDLALLPINGRDAVRLRRGCLGNMTWQEAVDLAGLLRPGLVCPAHYAMFANNTENPARFAEYLSVKFPNQAQLTPDAGRTYLLRRGCPAPVPLD